MTSVTDRSQVRATEWLLVLCISGTVCSIYWWKLLNGGGLIGGDTYPYFLPQKMVVAEAFEQGTLPLWHDLTGLGYPLHAESQAGVFYPSNQILYRLFDYHAAYQISVLLHYWLAFVFAWRLARCQNIGNAGALLAAVVYVYGWFPARISLEWSIIGGLWLPLTLWQTDRLLQAPGLRRWSLLTLCLATHLLAGHFALAFINQLAVVGYALLRRPVAATGKLSRWQRGGIVSLAIGGAIVTASVQLVPTAELKQVSQRQPADDEVADARRFDPAYGHLPPVYVTQVVASWWYWHTPEVRDVAIVQASFGAVSAGTNTVEAHLYWGLIPLALLVIAFRMHSRGSESNLILTWAAIGLFGIVYATGWPLLVTKHLPGFSYFMGPGRYTILAALSGGLLAGSGLHVLLLHRTRLTQMIATGVICGVTLVDVSWSSNVIAHATVVSTPPVEYLEKSWLRSFFENRPTARLLAPGPNVCNLLGVSNVPQYLGIGPAIYFSDRLHPEQQIPDGPDPYPTAAQTQHLKALGITHVLTLDPIEATTQYLQLRSHFPDSYLNAVWALGGRPVWLYDVVQPEGRIAAMPSEHLQSAELRTQHATEVVIDVELNEPATVVLKDLMYPGWKVSIDDRSADPAEHDLSMRAVRVPAGRHLIRWTFSSFSFQVGAAISLLSIALLSVALLRGNSKNSANPQAAAAHSAELPA